MDIKQLEDELNTTKEYLQATIEALETPHKEYKTANQKLRSVNEALQSAKEALDTSREDLQSTNGVTIAFIDITEWRQVHKLQRITAVFEKSSDAVTVQDVDGNIIAWNRAAERLYGWTEKEATRMHITEITAEKNRHEYAAVARKLLRGETVTPFEYVRIPKAVDPITV